MFQGRVSNYPVGSKVQTKSRYIMIKGEDGKWKAESRFVMADKLGRELEPNEKVYHLNGDREDNSAKNLVVIKFRATKYVPLVKRRILWMPKND